MYLLEIQHILNIIACTNQVIVFRKRMLIEQLCVFFVYTFSSVILIKTSIIVQANFSPS